MKYQHLPLNHYDTSVICEFYPKLAVETKKFRDRDCPSVY